MKVILCHSIAKKEILPLKHYFTLQSIKKYTEKAIKGLGTEISGASLSKTKLVKISLTGRSAGRMIVLILINKSYGTPLILRLKKDKLLGANLGKQNKNFQKLLQANLDLVMEDLETGNYEEL